MPVLVKSPCSGCTGCSAGISSHQGRLQRALSFNTDSDQDCKPDQWPCMSRQYPDIWCSRNLSQGSQFETATSNTRYVLPSLQPVGGLQSPNETPLIRHWIQIHEAHVCVLELLDIEISWLVPYHDHSRGSAHRRLTACFIGTRWRVRLPGDSTSNGDDPCDLLQLHYV